MCYNEFFSVIEKRLRGVLQDDLKKSMDYYGEMIADRMEDGLNEEEAVAALGSVDDIVYDIADGASIVSIVKSKVKPKKTLKAWQTVLIILGSPIWLSLIVAVLAVFLCAYVVLWSAVFTLYAVTLSAAVSALGCLLGSAALLFTNIRFKARLRSVRFWYVSDLRYRFCFYRIGWQRARYCLFNSLDIVYGSGNVNISAVTISYGFTASGKSGDLKFTDFDASYMDVSTTSGNVTDSLRTGKQFDVVSERGDVEIPESEDGGKCRIRTSTGDIKVSIKPNPLYQSE